MPVGPVPRPRRLQDRQRHPGPRRRRPPAGRCRRHGSAACSAPGDIAARSAATSSPSCSTTSPSLGGAVAVAERIIDALAGAVPRRGPRNHGRREHRHRRARGSGPSAADELLRNADVAMYRAKASGKNRVSVFEPTMHAAIVARHALSAELSRSLGRGELAVFYQPIVALRDRAASRASRRSSAGTTRPAA